MKFYSYFISFLLLVVCAACSDSPQRLLMGGSGWNKLVIIDKETKNIEWEHPLEKGSECNSVAATPDGNILFSYRKGAKLITRNHEELWTILAPKGCEMQTARVLPNGNYLLAWCGSPARVMEVDPKGNILSKTDFDTQISHAHAQFRQVNKNDKGNYLVPLFASSEVREISPAGKLVKKVKVPGNPFCIVALPNGNYMVACGDAHRYIELNYETGEVIKQIDADDIEGARLFFVAQILPTDNGGFYICNWQGHDKKNAIGKFPQLIEIDKEGKMVWNLNDNAKFGMISSISPID